MSYAQGTQKGSTVGEILGSVTKAVMEFLSTHLLTSRWIFRSMVQATMTVSLAIFFYAGYHIIREDSLSKGLHSAFFGTNQDILERVRQTEVAITQARIGQDANANRVIDQLFTQALTPSTAGVRLRLAVIHNGVAGVTGMSLLRADITNAVARPGRATGDLSVNLPMGSLATFAPSMLDGSCWLADTSSLSYNPGREHLERVGVKSFLACPVKDPNNLLLGEIAMHWDRGDMMPTPEEMVVLTRDMKILADKIGTIISLRPYTYSRAHATD